MDSPQLKPSALEGLRRALAARIDLSVARSDGTHYYHMQTEFAHIGFDGRRLGSETYVLRLRNVPAVSSGSPLDEYTCREFGIKTNDGPILTLPDLTQFTYHFDQMSGVLREGPFFGIPQGPFASLRDSSGLALAPDIAYATYNNFVDFHALCDVFSRPAKFIKGIEQLKWIGDRVVHPGAFTDAPVSLDGVVRRGSTFRNGELALELKGVSLVDGLPCALVNYDSGESLLHMAFIQSGAGDIAMEGGSRYAGDIYVDLESGWVRKVTLAESVVTQTHSPEHPTKAPGYTARRILLRLIDRSAFEEPLSTLAG